MSELVTGVVATLAFTSMLLFSLWILVDRQRLSGRPVEHLARAFLRAEGAASVYVVPSRYRRLSPEMVTEVAAAHGLRFDGQRFVSGGGLRMTFSSAPALPEGEGDD